MTKLPYVAGYNIKLAFIIQDISNLDEIYGEKSRQSLLGNCGYQLILGANDQTTAEYVSRALGKQTIRYQSESRTIELVGLPRRTKVEQIRERDLMMPQEVRKMADKNFVLLIEGQSPIFGDKLRYFETEPFKTAEAYSKANRPAVGKISLPVHKPVPAATDDYLNAGRKEEKTAAEVQRPLEPSETAPVENIIKVTGLTSDIAPVMAAEAVPDDAFALKVLEPKRTTLAEPVAPDEELSLEEGITLKVLGAKKAIPVDLFDETITDAENRTTSTTKKSSLKALKQVVLDLPETD
jgi:type IV secretion system protein VirD4